MELRKQAGLTRPSLKPFDMVARIGQWTPYALPYACLQCRKSFKRRVSREAGTATETGICPECGAETVRLSRQFKPPKSTDFAQWRKVEALVQAGFRFERLGEPYPETLAEVPAFVARHRHT
ncbi:MAG TPA: hypothetical protein PLO65_04485 [Caulobacter sp.]|nr:hypothetical protein [Caulobacter sp.]